MATSPDTAEILASALLRLHPGVQPLPANEFSTTDCDMRQRRQTANFAAQNVGYMRLRALKYFCDLMDRKNLIV